MKKRILLILAVLAALVAGMAILANASEQSYVKYCHYCGKDVTWQPFTSAVTSFADGHYYMAETFTVGAKTIASGNTVCLELNGKNYNGNRRIVVQDGGVLNVQGEGLLRGRGSDDFGPGRTVYIQAGGEMNLYDAALEGYSSTVRGANKGGVLAVAGTFNMYGGSIKDGIATQVGGDIYVADTGVCNLYGGSISGGDAPDGYCVYSEGQVTLAGSAAVERLELANVSADAFTIYDKYTGQVTLEVDTPQAGTVIGKSDKADLSGADITVYGTELLLQVSGTQLVLAQPKAVNVLKDGQILSSWDTVEQAAAALEPGQSLMLLQDVADEVTVNKELLLDLNGCSVAGLTAAEGVTVYVMDSKTADYDVTDGVYGRITTASGSVEGAPATETADGYMRYDGTDGVSFHAVGLKLTSINVRPSSTGLYYSGSFTGDSIVVANVKTYGVAMSVQEAPTAENMAEIGAYTALTTGFGSGDATATSSILENIMRPTQGNTTNRRNAQMQVYSTAYAQLADGSRITGYPRNRSLRDVMEYVDTVWESLGFIQRADVMAMYQQYSTVMDKWTIPNIQESIPEEEPLNVFFVSNSTCYYFTDELMGMLQAAGYEDVTLGLVYSSGCSIEKHWQGAQSGEAFYEFRVLDKYGLHSYPGYSLEDALAAYDWNVISFDNNARSFASGDVQTSLANAEPYFGQLLAFVQERKPDARYLWHEVWANEIGYSLAFNMETVEQRTQVWQAKKGVAQIMEKTYGIDVVPTGDAWEPVRDLPLFTTPVEGTGVEKFTLCSRVTAAGAFKDDFTHDGDIGGGQYLNACVWFEVLTGTSCRGNAYRPAYTLKGIDCSLTEEKIQVLQNAAHDAVKGWGYEVTEEKLDILFVGDSASYYWTDELYGMLTEAGYKNVRVCNVYYSTNIKTLWNYHTNDKAVFTFFTVDANGRNSVENVTLDYAFDAYDWDCISFHQGKSAMSGSDKAAILADTQPYIANFLAYVKEKHPDARYFWDENWVCEIGYSNSTYTMESKEQQTQMLETIRYVAQEVSKANGLTVIPNGDAWTPVRDLPLFTTPIPGTGVEKFTLCSRITAAGTFKDDLGHDGDIGGGQYLNACVAFEVITGKSCVGSTYDPQYILKGIDCSLSAEKREALQNAAHQAVANWN